ncbi:unnamed protein product [Didymodactylos carnosus]|uniref:Tetratricopeptide repeat protein n=1 Tax=Didymodactylos carnosus TaxID=1234261 RepID=A0A815UC01_9BILA|nr:unnamed protein product [Didymodactylos carnosus]CAF1517705.1 unnamed protein product [Didymodactylos carnosus]CAF3785372.1 unnamed protein product [Didymodactylos carnosus]CAF4377517.1 unnamed protein product [Didymodactylos carnosus]
MIQVRYEYYRDNDKKENGNINEFRLDQITSDNVICWYTRPCFCYRLINKTLFTQVPDCLFTFRYIITNIHKQLDILYKQNRNDTLTPNTNSFISKAEQVANIYCSRDQQNRYEPSFFKLNIGIDSQVPYASIQEHSVIPDEDEVLFSVDTVWRIKSVNQGEDKVWNIVLDLVADQCCIELANYLKEQLGEETTLLTFGNLLSELGEYEKAIRYYKILLKKLSADDNERSTIYNKLSYLRYEQGEYSLAEEYYRLAISYLKDKEDEHIKINDNPFDLIDVQGCEKCFARGVQLQ